MEICAGEIARRYLDELEQDPNQFGPGRRNDDTVNALIACRVLGIDFYDWHGNVGPELQEHIDRIEPYLNDWFKDGPETAVQYMV
jgi:hypothetical protein